MPKKIKKPTYSKLKKRLDQVFSIWTRLRFADQYGNVTCVCGQECAPWKLMQAGHFVSRSYLATRWHPENVAPQSMQCNVFKAGNLAAYAAWGVNRYGMDWPARMVALSKQPTKYSRSDLQDMITDYEGKIEALNTSCT